MQHVFKLMATLMLMVAVVCATGCTKGSGNGGNNDANGTEKGAVNGSRGIAYGHDYVDLGLPSGTLWATCNVGANSPEEFGDCFAWGETEPKGFYSWATYKYCNGAFNSLTKYCNQSGYGNNGFTDNLITLVPEDDAATANWGGDWRMPTKDEWNELLYYTTAVDLTQNGVAGWLFVAANGESIFLPSAIGHVGSLSNGLNEYYQGYWSSSLCTVFPYDAWEYYYDIVEYLYRYCGLPVRAVRSAP